MKVKIFVIASAIAALMSPLIASAATLPAIPFTDLSTVNYSLGGTAKNATFTLTDLNSATAKVTQAYKLTNGSIDPSSSAAFIFDKNSTPAAPMQGLKINLYEVNDYVDINGLLQGQAILKAVMLRTGPKTTSLSGQGTVEIHIPASTTFNTSFADFSTVFTTPQQSKPARTVRQEVMQGAAGFAINVKNINNTPPSSGILTIGAIKPAFATIQTVTKRYSGTTAFGNTSGIIPIEDSTQNLKASLPVLTGGKITSFTHIFP